MPNTFQFWTPAHQIDFPDDQGKQQQLNEQWNLNLNGFTQQGMAGNPWNSSNTNPITNYFNPIDTPIPAGNTPQPIEWNAFPGRISHYFPNLSPEQIFCLADSGYLPPDPSQIPVTDDLCTTLAQQPSFPNITKDPCSGASIDKPFGPYGPRGWQDEYCEWAVTRNADGKITRIDFTCENPEYWNSLWMIDPDTVLSLYQTTLGKPQIQMSDLVLYDSNGNPVIDPSTGRPAYNPLNIWNSGPCSTAVAGGAMHLTSTPNTLQTEIGLATAATIQRTVGNSNFNSLICCAQYGQPYRNSDPNIGGSVNQLVSMGLTVTLTNPPGLYIQQPNFDPSIFKTPDGTNAANFWTIVRGTSTLNDESGNPLPGNFILHAVFEVPESYGYTVSDIKINGVNINWGGQVTQTITMHILGSGLPAPVPATMACVGTPATIYAQPLQCFHQAIFDAMSAINVPNPVQFPMTLLSNSTLIAPLVWQGQQSVQLAITVAPSTTYDPNDPSTWPTVTFDGTDITAQVTAVGSVTYAVPGNSYPAAAAYLYVTITLDGTAKTGLRNVYVTDPGSAVSQPMPALLNVQETIVIS